MIKSRIVLNKHLFTAFLIAIFSLMTLLRTDGASAQALAPGCGKWSLVYSPSTGTMDILYSTAAISPQDVWAVGRFINSQGFNQALIEHWNGKQWRLIPSPNPPSSTSYLHGIAAVSSNDVWAVGATT